MIFLKTIYSFNKVRNFQICACPVVSIKIIKTVHTKNKKKLIFALSKLTHTGVQRYCDK